MNVMMDGGGGSIHCGDRPVLKVLVVMVVVILVMVVVVVVLILVSVFRDDSIIVWLICLWLSVSWLY